MWKNLVFVGVIGVMLGAGWFVTRRPSEVGQTQVLPTPKKEVDIKAEGLPGIQTGTETWTAGGEKLRERLEAIGLPALAAEGTALHSHQHLDVYINGKKIGVPSGIGISEKERFISTIHTHDEEGIIHVESPTIQRFTLGQFFDVWGVRFDDKCMGGYCSEGDKKLRVYNNGQEVVNNFRDVELLERQEIGIVFGEDKDVPSEYAFPPDY